MKRLAIHMSAKIPNFYVEMPVHMQNNFEISETDFVRISHGLNIAVD